MRHPKFLALSGNAISLWHEGKDYCDTHQTDGIIPIEALKTFRFAGKKTKGLLIASCGPKPDGTPYAPLWESHPVGFRMHDYLHHNDCREAVLARIESADERRDADRARKAEWRSRKKDTRDMSRGTTDGTSSGTETSPSRSKQHQHQQQTELPKNGNSGRSAETHDVSPVALKFPTDGTPQEWPLTERQIVEWLTLYPSLDVLAECRKARAWIDADPKRRKTAGGMRRFLVNWLNNATNRPHAVSGAGSRTSGNAAALQRFAARGGTRE